MLAIVQWQRSTTRTAPSFGGKIGYFSFSLKIERLCFRYGLLGLKDEKDQYFPFEVTLAGSVKDIQIGPDHSLFLVKN